MTRDARKISLFLAALLLAGLNGSPALAEPFGPYEAGGGYWADNSEHTFFYNNLTGPVRNLIEGRRLYALDPTRMTTTLQTTSFNSDTDVLVYDDNYGSGFPPGKWECMAVLSDYERCGQGRILVNLYFNTNAALACQEIGHSTGLGHSTESGSCMIQNSDVGGTNFTPHDKLHINGRY